MRRTDFINEKNLIYDLLNTKCDALKARGFDKADLYRLKWELILDRYDNVEYESPTVYRVFRVSDMAFPIHYNINYLQDAINANSSSVKKKKACIKDGVLLVDGKAVSFNRYSGEEKYGNIATEDRFITKENLGTIIIGKVHLSDYVKGLAVLDGNHRINLASEQEFNEEFDVYLIEDELMIRSIFTLYEVFAYLICDNIYNYGFGKTEVDDSCFDGAIKYNKLVINYMENRRKAIC